MRRYLCYESDIILGKTDEFTVFFNANVSLSTKRPVSDVISILARSGAFGWHYVFFLRSTSKRCFSYN